MIDSTGDDILADLKAVKKKFNFAHLQSFNIFELTWIQNLNRAVFKLLNIADGLLKIELTV